MKSCADALREIGADNGETYELPTILPRANHSAPDLKIPIIGGGDVYSAQAYYEAIDNYGVDAVMIGRGALIKPWFL